MFERTQEQHRGQPRRDGHDEADLEAPEHVLVLPQAENEKRHGHHQPDRRAGGELPTKGQEEDGQDGHQQDFDDIHVGHDVALGEQIQAEHHQTGEDDAVFVVQFPELRRGQGSAE